MNLKLGIVSPLIILALIFILLTVSLFKHKYKEQESLFQLKHEVIVATKISQLVHELQRERGFSVGFSSNSHNYKEPLRLQRIKTNDKINQLNSFFRETLTDDCDINIANAIKTALSKVDNINKIREEVDNKTAPIRTILSYYRKVNNFFLNIVFNISKSSKTPIITQNLTAYSHFLYLKEYMGRERAFGINIINIDIMFLRSKLQFHKLLIQEDVYKELFFKYASDNAISYYKKAVNGESLIEINRIRDKILKTPKREKIETNIDSWFLNITMQIDILKMIDDYLAGETINNIEHQYSKLERDLSLFTILNIFSLGIFISMLLLIIRLLQKEKDLKGLIDKYVITSTTDLRGVITDVSQAFSNISGYKKSELIGQQHNIVRDSTMTKQVFKEMWYTIQNGNTWYGNIKNRNKDGSFYWVYAIVSPLYHNGRKIGYSAIRQDITTKKEIIDLNVRLEEKISEEVEKNRQKDKQLIEQSRLAQMGEMLSMIAHQWRQPLNAISFNSAGLELKAQLNKADANTVLDASKVISHNVHYLSQTIDDFKNFFKKDKVKQKVSYTQVIQNTLQIILPSIKEKKIELIQELDFQEEFFTYSNELQHVLLNILKNAEDILDEKDILKPYIKISTYLKDENYILEIADNGGGIDEDYIVKVFNPYFSTKLEKEGTGLGLYMSKMIIEEHCLGKLNVRNSEEGAIFQIQLHNIEEG